MDAADLNAKWDEFMAFSGTDLEQDIASTLQSTRHLLDIHDGTHASWHDDKLGVLLVFGPSEASGLVGAWHDCDEGNLIALSRILDWLGGLVSMVEQCVALYGTTDFD